MRIAEKDYIKITNITNLSRALDAMRDITPGKKYGVDEKKFKEIHLNLALMQKQLFDESN